MELEKIRTNKTEHVATLTDEEIRRAVGAFVAQQAGVTLDESVAISVRFDRREVAPDIEQKNGAALSCRVSVVVDHAAAPRASQG